MTVGEVMDGLKIGVEVRWKRLLWSCLVYLYGYGFAGGCGLLDYWTTQGMDRRYQVHNVCIEPRGFLSTRTKH